MDKKQKTRNPQYLAIHRSNCQVDVCLQSAKVRSKYDSRKHTHATSYFMAIVMIAVSVTILELFAVEISVTLTLTLTLTFRRAKVKCKYVNRKPLCDFVFDGSSNVCPMSPF